jgi:hypothetical protein
MSSFNFNPAGVVAALSSAGGLAGWRNLGERIAAEARRTAPVSDRPGQHLRDHIESRPTLSAAGPVVYVGSSLPQSAYVNKGTRAHGIDPVNARVLAFTTRGGQMVFAAHVNHPGTKPNGYILAAARRVLQGARP